MKPEIQDGTHCFGKCWCGKDHTEPPTQPETSGWFRWIDWSGVDTAFEDAYNELLDEVRYSHDTA